jgi:hypothetical protein
VRPSSGAVGSPSRRGPRPAVRHAGRRAGARRTGRPAWMDPGRRHHDAAWAAPRNLPAALFRRLPRRGSAPGPPVPGRGRRPRAHPGGPGQNYRSCWSTAWSAGCGISGAPGAENPFLWHYDHHADASAPAPNRRISHDRRGQRSSRSATDVPERERTERGLGARGPSGAGVADGAHIGFPVRQSELGQKGAGRWVRGWQEEGSGFYRQLP